MASVAVTGATLCLLLVSGGAEWLRDLVEQSAQGLVVSTAGYALVLMLVIEGVELPFAYYKGVTLERRYGLAMHEAWHWWLDRAKALVIGLGFGALAAVIVWTLLRWTPQYWWAVAAGVFAAVTVALAQIAPVLLMPIFYHVVPLRRPDLAERLMALGRRVNAQVTGVFEWRLSDRTRKANAALAGLGRTRRILLSDTLLAEHSDEEIEVILAHELAHHVHRDIWSALALDAALLALGLFAADRALTLAWPWLGLTGKTDLAGMPLVLVIGGAVVFILQPAAHALSRLHERRADRFALDLTRSPDAFVSAMKRLSARNLAEERPSRVVEILFLSHPPTHARIAAARGWMPGTGVDGPGGVTCRGRRAGRAWRHGGDRS
jgi:STE24 endopeptidase